MRADEGQPRAEMPRFQSYKQVWALRIAALEVHKDKSATIAPADDGYTPFRTRPGWAERFTGSEADLGYFVQYADGFTSWSPGKAFEEGYAPISWAAMRQVRMSFNPSRLQMVDRLKGMAAAFITACDEVARTNPDGAREAAVAKTNAQQASMWAVAAATADL